MSPLQAHSSPPQARLPVALQSPRHAAGRPQPGRLFLCAAWRAAVQAERDRRSHELSKKRRVSLLTGPFSLQLPLPDRVISAPASEPRPGASQTSQRSNRGSDEAEDFGEARASRSPDAPSSLRRPHAEPGGDTKRRVRLDPARERPRQRDSLSETWSRFKA